MSAKAERLRGRLSINPDVTPAPPATPAAPAAVPEPGPQTPAARPLAPVASGGEGHYPNALADPDILAGRKSYRSFYVDDEPFARFRAAIYWSCRQRDVPDNMSAAVEAWMLEVATDLERRYNNGEVFDMPPKRPKSEK